MKALGLLLGLDRLLQPIQALLELLHCDLELPHLFLQPGYGILGSQHCFRPSSIPDSSYPHISQASSQECQGLGPLSLSCLLPRNLQAYKPETFLKPQDYPLPAPKGPPTL